MSHIGWPLVTVLRNVFEAFDIPAMGTERRHIYSYVTSVLW